MASCWSSSVSRTSPPRSRAARGDEPRRLGGAPRSPAADAPALADGERVHATWAEFAARTAGAAAGLRDDLGLAPGDRVAIVMRNRPEYLEAQYAVWHAGLVAVPVNARLHRDEIAYILDDSGTASSSPTTAHADDVDALVGTVATVDRAVLVPGPDVGPAHRDARRCRWSTGSRDDPAWLFYTSGTTGRPKGATLTHRNLLMASLSYFADIDPVAAAGQRPARRAAVARLRALRAAPRGAGRGERRPGSGGARRRRARCAAGARWPGHVVLRRADHGQAAGRRPGARRRRPRAAA